MSVSSADKCLEHSNVAIVARVVRVVDAKVQDERVAEAVDWLERSWHGEPYIPDELLPAAV
jgi:hypothetical protein